MIVYELIIKFQNFNFKITTSVSFLKFFSKNNQRWQLGNEEGRAVRLASSAFWPLGGGAEREGGTPMKKGAGRIARSHWQNDERPTAKPVA